MYAVRWHLDHRADAGVAVPKVGQQRVARRNREIGNAKSAGFAVVARKGDTVVRATSNWDRYPSEGALTYPKPIAKKTWSRSIG